MEAWEAITAVPALFTTEWTTTANSESITLPYGTGTYTGTIDWGDGNTDVNDGSVTTHTYATAGTYTVIIDGDCIGWYFGTYGGTTYLTSVVNWGQLQLGPENSGYNFYACPNLDLSSVQGTLDLTGVTNFDGLFLDCTSLTTINNINSWDTSAITSMNEMFVNCNSFNQALSFDTSAVTSMSGMFSNCTAFNSALTFNTSAVTNMGSMFSNCSVFNQPLTFNTGAITDMSFMFENCSVFNSALTFSSTSAVQYMSSMFNNCTSFNQALSFNTSAVEFMDRMFRDATAFNQNISSFNTGAVTNMESMFKDATAFNQNIGTWDVANVTNFYGFMTGKTPATFSTTNLNAIYNGWSTQSVQPSLDIDFGTAKYTAAATAGRLVLTGTALWTITDGGL
jgi:surface protein